MKNLPETIFENENFVVLNKPAGLLSIPDREGKDISLKKWLQEKYTDIFTVHRLDRQTSGLIVFAKNEHTHKFLSQAFESRTVTKIYLGIVKGIPTSKKGTIDSPIAEHPHKLGTMVIHKKGKTAITDFEVIDEMGICSLLQFQIHTGRTHQIRVHMQSIGHPILCDEMYGDGQPVMVSSIKRNYKISKSEEEEKPILNRLALHSFKLAFTIEDGTPFEFEQPLPKDMRALIQQLHKWRK